MCAQDPATLAIDDVERGILDCSESLLILGRAGEIRHTRYFNSLLSWLQCNLHDCKPECGLINAKEWPDAEQNLIIHLRWIPC